MPRTHLSPISAGGPAFFSSEDARQRVYAGGLALAALLDVKLRQAGHTDGLETLMRSLNNDPRWTIDGAAPTIADLLDVVERLTDAATSRKVAGWLDGTSPQEIDAELSVLERRSREPANHPGDG